MTTTNTDFENNRYIKAVEQVGEIKEFYQNIIMMPILVFINVHFYSQFHWFWFPMFGWGIGLAIHVFKTFGYDVFFGKNWKKKVKELMDNE